MGRGLCELNNCLRRPPIGYALAIYRVFCVFKNGDLTGLRSADHRLTCLRENGRLEGGTQPENQRPISPEKKAP